MKKKKVGTMPTQTSGYLAVSMPKTAYNCKGEFFPSQLSQDERLKKPGIEKRTMQQ
jgi:hypothetical protein